MAWAPRFILTSAQSEGHIQERGLGKPAGIALSAFSVGFRGSSVLSSCLKCFRVAHRSETAENSQAEPAELRPDHPVATLERPAVPWLPSARRLELCALHLRPGTQPMHRKPRPKTRLPNKQTNKNKKSGATHKHGVACFHPWCMTHAWRTHKARRGQALQHTPGVPGGLSSGAGLQVGALGRGGVGGLGPLGHISGGWSRSRKGNQQPEPVLSQLGAWGSDQVRPGNWSG